LCGLNVAPVSLRQVEDLMRDLLYILATVGFFAVMLAYVSGCERLGRGNDRVERGP